MTYEEALTMLYQSAKYGFSIPDIDNMSVEEVINYAEQMYIYGDALEAQATGN